MSRRRSGPPVVVQMGAPEWVVTFGDLMSLLLTFFVLLFSISEVKSDKVFDMIMSFRTEFDFDTDADGAHLLDFSEVVSLLSTLSRQLPGKSEGHQGMSDERIENPFGPHASIHRVKDDFHIDVEGSVLFPEGSTEIAPEGRELIARMSERLRGGYNRIRVVGSASPGRSGTDELLLGFQRARAVQELLVRGKDGEGVRPERIEIATRGTLEPLTLPELIDPERRAVRDRVVIILTPEPVEELFETQSRRPVPAAAADDEEE